MKTLKIASLAFALSLTTISAARAETAQADLAEAGAPDSILNGNAETPVAGSVHNEQVAEAEAGNPHSVDYGRRMLVLVNQRQLARDVLVAESGNPHAVR